METNCVPLHEHKYYLDKCVEILNEEWPRSKTAREHSLTKCMPSKMATCPGLPCALVLVTGTERAREATVLGHSRLMPVLGDPSGCLIESVVIKKSHRGTGLGRKLMSGSEKHASSLGLKTMYLITRDKQEFYKHIGYFICEPVSFSAFISSSQQSDNQAYNKFLQQFGPMCCVDNQKQDIAKEDKMHASCTDSSTQCKGSLPAPLLSPPPPPAPPPPVPAPESTKNKKSSGQVKYGKTIERIDNSLVSWMKKQLT